MGGTPKCLSVQRSAYTSTSFCLINRLSTHNEVADLALAELLEYNGIVLIEWGDVVAGSLGDHLLVHLEPDADDEDSRAIAVSGVGRAWAGRWEHVEAVLGAYAC